MTAISHESGLRSGTASQLDTLLRGRAHHHAVAGRDASGGVPTLLCASGRGGSGTSLVAALLAAAAAGDGYRVLLIDTDDLVGPLAALLGARPNASWMDLRGARMSPQDVATPVSTTLTLVAGGAAHSGDRGPVAAAERRACMRRLSGLAERMDLVVFDCGARLDAVAAAMASHSSEQLLAITAGGDAVSLAATYALCKAARARASALSVELLVNRIHGPDAARCFDAVDAGTRQFLGTTLRFAGALPFDPTLEAALRAGMPFLDSAAGSPAAIAAHEVVMRTLAGASHSRPGV